MCWQAVRPRQHDCVTTKPQLTGTALQNDLAEKENINSFCEAIKNADIYKHNKSSNARLKKEYVYFKLQEVKNVNFGVKRNSDTDVFKQKRNIINSALFKKLYSEYNQLTDDELCPQDNQALKMITLIKLLINLEYRSTYNMLQAAYKKLLHCNWNKKPVMKVYNIAVKFYIYYILAIFEEKQIDFLSLSDLAYAVYVISMFPLR